MPIEVQHDQQRNELHIIFRRDKFIAYREHFAANGVIEIALDGTPIAITYLQYYTARDWTLTEEHVTKYALGEYLDDLRLVHQAFFTDSQLGFKEIRFEGPDGNEQIITSDGTRR